MKEKNGDNTIIQVMRGIAIILVLIHHSTVKANDSELLKVIDNIIICFHMPIFFIISGFLFQKKYEKYIKEGRKKFLIQKFKHLIIPYLFWATVLYTGIQIAGNCSAYLKEALDNYGFSPMSFGKFIYGLFTYQFFYTEHLWFLYVLFVYFAIHIFVNKKYINYFTFLIFVIGCFSSIFELPYIVEKICLWHVFFAFGRIIAESKILKKIAERKWNFLIATLLTIVFIFLRILIKNGDTLYIAIFSQIVKYILGFLGTFIVYSFSAKMNRFKLLSKIGDYSYGIYLMHNPYIVAPCSILLSSILPIPTLFVIIIAVSLGIVIPILLEKFLIERVKLFSIMMIGKEK